MAIKEEYIEVVPRTIVSHHVFDPHAFIEAIGAAVVIIVQTSIMAATIAQTSATVDQGGTSNL